MNTSTGEAPCIPETIRQRVVDAYDGYQDEIDRDELEQILEKVNEKSSDEVVYNEVTNILINELTSRIEREPAYSKIASRIFRQQYYQEIMSGSQNDFESTYRSTFVNNIQRAVELDLLDSRMLDFDLDRLATTLVIDRDDDLDYMGISTLYQRYVLQTGENERLELPQAFWMRVAMGLALEEDEYNRRACEFYEIMSSLKFIPSTPTLFHSGKPEPQLSSCYITSVEDELSNVFDSYKEHALLSKVSSGLAHDWTNIRAQGSIIEGTGQESAGLIPFLKISNDVTSAVNQVGQRRGAACAYLECWHLDFPDFIDLRRTTGDERRRTHDQHTAAWVPDLFMKRVRAGSTWTLFSPDEVPELHDLYGNDFEKKYRDYEKMAERDEIDQYERIEAKSLWKDILNRLFETGHPWITFKDPCNIRSPQDHDGIIHSSNLCTEITLNTSAEETAVYNLGSVNLVEFIDEGDIDWASLSNAVSTAMRMLDNVIDLDSYPTQGAKRGNLNERPVGLGVMGLHDTFMEIDICMDSDEGDRFSDELQEFISYHAILNSSKLAKERGTYPSYEGSKWDRGILPQDTIELLESERGREIPINKSGHLDWSDVREHIDKYGMRNSNTQAIAPTATISTIAGVSPSIEPIYSNLYVKSNLSGDFTIINKYLIDELKEQGLWDRKMIDDLKNSDGSTQSIDRIPSELREKYKGAFEIDPLRRLHQNAARGKWIDQSQSHNIFFSSSDGELLNEIYQTAWELGIKTTYYLRTMGASQVEKTTLDPREFGKTQIRGD